MLGFEIQREDKPDHFDLIGFCPHCRRPTDNDYGDESGKDDCSWTGYYCGNEDTWRPCDYPKKQNACEQIFIMCNACKEPADKNEFMDWLNYTGKSELTNWLPIDYTITKYGIVKIEQVGHIPEDCEIDDLEENLHMLNWENVTGYWGNSGDGDYTFFRGTCTKCSKKYEEIVQGD